MLEPPQDSPATVAKARRAREARLTSWRKGEAKKRGVDEQVVLPGHCLQDLADLESIARKTIASVRGFGAFRSGTSTRALLALRGPDAARGRAGRCRRVTLKDESSAVDRRMQACTGASRRRRRGLGRSRGGGASSRALRACPRHSAMGGCGARQRGGRRARRRSARHDRARRSRRSRGGRAASVSRTRASAPRSIAGKPHAALLVNYTEFNTRLAERTCGPAGPACSGTARLRSGRGEPARACLCGATSIAWR